MFRSNKKLVLIVFSFALSFFLFCIFIAYPYLQNRKAKVDIKVTETIKPSDKSDEPERLICDRTTRLENNPNIDRALSLIYERLTEYGEDKRLFTPQLVNCIKVDIENIKNESG